MRNTQTLVLMLAALLALGGLAFAGPFTYVREYNASGGYMGQPAGFSDPRGLAVGPNRIYVSDHSMEGVWMLDMNDTVLKKVGVSGVTDGTLARPNGMFLDGSGSLYIADFGVAGVIRFTEPSSIQRIGPAASLGREPVAVWTDNDTMYLIDRISDNVKVYSVNSGRNLFDILGPGIGTDKILGAQDIYMDEAHVYIADTKNNRIQIYDRNFSFTDTLGSGLGNVTLSGPISVAADADAVYVADSDNNRVVMFGMDGYPIAILGGEKGHGDYQLDKPRSVRLYGGELFVLDSNNKRVVEYKISKEDAKAALMAQIADLNASVNDYTARVLSVMDRLNVSHDALRAPAWIAQATYASAQGKNNDASKLLAQAKSELDAIRLNGSQSLQKEIQKRIDAGFAVVDRYKGLAMSQQQADAKAVLVNRLNDAQNKLKAQDWAGAADAVLACAPDTDAFSRSMEAALSNQTNAGAPAPAPDAVRKALLQSQADLIVARMQSLQDRAAALKQDVNTVPAKTLVDSARALILAGAYDEANRSVDAAGRYTDQLASQLQLKENDINAALIALNKSNATLQQNVAGWTATGLDYRAVADKLAAAQAKAYADPKGAQALADEADRQMEALSAQASNREFALGGVGAGLFVVVAMLALAAYLVLKRKKKGMRK